MLKSIHFLLTYNCNFQCDHCFLYCGPDSEGTFTIRQLRQVYDEIKKIETIKSVCFEGGEPFLYYPLMLEGIRIANELGLKTSVVTNAYWSTEIDDAALWLEPLRKLGVSDISLSDDQFHGSDDEESPAKIAKKAAEKMRLPGGTICIEAPRVEKDGNGEQMKGEPVVGGGVMFKGRAVEKLTGGLPQKHWEKFISCPFEDLENPGRVHLDAFGNVHLCQGLSIGNIWKVPLSSLIKNYHPASHPICGPLVEGGPALLAKEYSVKHEDSYINECHFCYLIRRALIDEFPQFLSPRQVYGLE